MAKEIVWTFQSQKKFEEIINYLELEWNENITKNFVNTVFNFLDLVSVFPEIGSLENKDKNIRGFLILDFLKIFYRIKGNKIILLDIFDTKQNPNKIKK